MRNLTRLAAFGAAATLALMTGAVAPAAAAPGDPFDPARPTIFISQGTPTQLSTAAVDENGDFAFSSEGAVASTEYNGIGFNTADNYLYGFTSIGDGTIPATALVRIGEGGVVTRVGTSLFPSDGNNTSLQVGAFGPGGFLYAADTTGSNMYVVDVTDGTLEATIPITGGSLNAAGQVSDWSFSQGYLWGVGDGRVIVRVDPATGELDQWTLDTDQVSAGFAGAAWTYLDGTLGFSHNNSGRIDRIQVTDPASANPTFTLVDSRVGPQNGRNDGAASPGLPVDLAVTKTSAGFAAGATVTYTITVTNNGAGWSTGWAIADDVDPALTNVTATSPDAVCGVVGNAVDCAGGELQPTETATITVTGAVPATQTADVTNGVTVVGNEPDPNLANNAATVVDRVLPATPVSPAAPGAPLTGAESASSTLPLGLLAGGLLLTAAAAGGAYQARRRS